MITFQYELNLQSLRLKEKLRFPVNLVAIQDNDENWHQLTELSGSLTTQHNNKLNLKLSECLFDTGNETDSVVLSKAYYQSFNRLMNLTDTDYSSSTLTYAIGENGESMAYKSNSSLVFKLKSVIFQCRVMFVEKVSIYNLFSMIFGMETFMQLITTIVPINDEEFDFYFKNRETII